MVILVVIRCCPRIDPMKGFFLALVVLVLADSPGLDGNSGAGAW